MSNEIERTWALIELNGLLHLSPRYIPTKEQMKRIEELEKIVYGDGE